MEPALQRRIQRYGWDKASALYEDFWQRQLRPAQDLLLEMAALKPGDSVLDTACGTGLVSYRAAEIVGEKGFLLGTDISEKMVELASANSKQIRGATMQFERMDAEDLQVDDDKFDAALCALGLMYMPDPIKALREMLRVVKPEGRAVAAVWGSRANCGWAEVFEIVDKRVSSEVCPMFFNLGNSDMLKRSFEAAGFKNVVAQKINVDLIYDSAEAACGAAFEGGPVALAYFKFNENVKKEANEEYIESIASFKKDKGYQIPGEFVVARGFK